MQTYTALGKTCRQAWCRYSEWVAANPGLVADTETAIKWCSYLAAGYMGRSKVVLSELLYSAANLVTFLNDRILEGQLNNLKEPHFRYFEYLLSVLEQVEVFFELAAYKFGGPAFKWTVIVSLQVLKTVLRLSLLYKYSGRMLVQPIIRPLDRNLLLAGGVKDYPASGSQQVPSSSTFTLRQSGRVIRKLDGAPPSFARDWGGTQGTSDKGPVLLEGGRRVGELMHVIQPMAHLMAMGIFGDSSWSPWLLSLLLDCSSQALLSSSSVSLTEGERREMVRRKIGLLNYLLRSPFYDRRSKSVIEGLLKFSQTNIPLTGSLSRALLRYLPEYQKVYFYVWG